MSINFKRNRAQTTYEQFIGVMSQNDLQKNKNVFKNHILSQNEASSLLVALHEDAIDLFYNGILSFSEGIDSIYNKRFSWATIKLYYTVYYLIRTSFATKDIAILRCDRMFRLPVRQGQQPYSTGNKKYNSTHEGTINHYKDLFSMSDPLLSNKIEDNDAFQWMRNAREIVNYRSSSFREPNCLEIWNYFSNCINDNSMSQILKQLEEDAYTLCFQEEYAIVAIPIKLIQQTINDMENTRLLNRLSKERKSFIRSLINYDNRSLTIFPKIFI
uniref:Uncharacterized protein n=1 Tax=uncultured bacterium contig00013 TaxID=1181504 RepID=A0A806K0R2_9BACT|nr:hypothetical protein [uncultured bacterium contig00013]